MKYSPFSIKNQDFNKSFRGFDTEEVKVFLEKLSDEYQQLLNENELLNKENKELKAKILEYKKIEKSLQNTLLNAQESTSKSVETAKKQTALILKEAEIKAHQIIEKANIKADFIYNAAANLKEGKNLFLAQLKAMIKTQSEILNISFVEQEMKSEEKKIEKNNKETKEINVGDILEKLL